MPDPLPSLDDLSAAQAEVRRLRALLAMVHRRLYSAAVSSTHRKAEKIHDEIVALLEDELSEEELTPEA